MKVLITGGAGFIGSHVAQYYHDKSYDVYVLDNLSSGYRENIPFIDNNHFFKVDICESENIKAIIEDYKFEIIIHLAAIVSVVDTVNNPIKSNEVNINATVNLLEANRLYNTNLQKFVFASSAAIYGNNPNLPKTTESVVQSESPYAIQKYSGEQYTKLYNHLYNLPTTALRFFNIYGPKQDPKSQYSGVISIMKNKFENDEVFTFFGDGNQTRDFVYVKDLVNAISLIVRTTYTNGQVFNVGNGDKTSLKDIFNTFNSHFNKTIDYKFEDARKGDVKHSFADITPLKNIGFEPQYNINSGLKEYLENEKNKDGVFENESKY